MFVGGVFGGFTMVCYGCRLVYCREGLYVCMILHVCTAHILLDAILDNLLDGEVDYPIPSSLTKHT